MAPRGKKPSGIAGAVAGGDKTAVARALNLVEDRRESAHAEVQSLLAELARAPKSDASRRIGLTGPPGVGKSTLASALALELRSRGRTVGVVAVDPSSVRSGGALLGDRARMAFDPKDEGVFVRSLATAGDAGGLAWAANAAVRVLAAAYDVVLVETTGVGQTETDVEHVADTVALVVQPGSGDALQFLKAGIMEIPDVLVVNKADHVELARRTAVDLRAALRTAIAAGALTGEPGWEIPIVQTSARDRTGIGELADALDAHRVALGEDGVAARRRRGSAEWALRTFERRFGQYGIEVLGGRDAVRARIDDAVSRGEPPLAVGAALGAEFLERSRHARS